MRGSDRSGNDDLLRVVVSVVRIAMAVLVLVALAGTFATATRPVNLFNFFGFFTVQGNLAGAAVLLATAVLSLRGRPEPYLLVVARAALMSYLVMVGLVYNTLLTDVAGGVALPWANTVVHVVFPLYCLLDWLLVGDRPRLRWRVLRAILVYPLVWTVVVLIRGATDGWVPYPFLNPRQGYGAVFGWVVLVGIAFAASGVLILALSRIRILRLPIGPAPRNSISGR